MNNRRLVLTSIVVGMLIASLDSTIMNTVMPIVAKDLGGMSLYAWSFAAYMIISTVTAPIYGRLSDIFGRKPVFMASLLLFGIGSVLCGFSHSMLELVIFRGLQGIGAGGIMPLSSTIAGDLFAVEQRGKIQALFTAMWGLSAILAPTLGSFFVACLTWRWIFYVNVPLVVLAILFLIPYREPKDHFKKVPIDYVGALLFSAAIFSLLSLTAASSGKWILAAAGAALSVLFVLWEKRVKAPFLPLPMLARGLVSQLSVNTFLLCAGSFAIGTYLPLFMSVHHGDSTFMSGFVLLGTSAGWMAGAVPAGKMFLKMGVKKPVAIGNAVSLAGAAMLLALSPSTNYWYVFAAMAVSGYGFGLTFASGTIAAQESVEISQKGVVTSLLTFSRNVGTSVGVTLMGAFIADKAESLSGFSLSIQYGVAVGALALVSAFFVGRRAKAA